MANISNILKCTTQLADGNNVGTDQTVTSGKNEFVSESIPSNQTDLPLAFAFTTFTTAARRKSSISKRALPTSGT